MNSAIINPGTSNPGTVKRWLVIVWLVTILSAIAVVTVRHHNRLAFIAWRNVEAGKIELQAEQGRLLLEKATWARRHNIVDDARDRLQMAAPVPGKIITLKLENER